MMVPVQLNSEQLKMELDTGAAISVLSESTFKSSGLQASVTVSPTNMVLRTYLGKELPLLGTVEVEVKYESQTKRLPLVIVRGEGANLFGRNWLEHIHLNWSSVHSINIPDTTSVEKIVARHPELFRTEIGTLKGVEATITVPLNAQARFHKPRPVPYAIKQRVEEELERLLKDGVISPVKFSDWAAPIVPVVKADGKIRICGDYSVTVNRVAKLDLRMDLRDQLPSYHVL